MERLYSQGASLQHPGLDGHFQGWGWVKGVPDTLCYTLPVSVPAKDLDGPSYALQCCLTQKHDWSLIQFGVQ